MGVIAHFGGYDVENYGDLLFPAILEYRLADLGHEFVHASPRGGPPVWGDCLPTVPAETVDDRASSLAAVVVGGGHIIHASSTPLEDYNTGGLSSIVAYPSLWLGAAHTAVQRDIPLCWNAPGVPQDFSPVGARLVEWASSVTDYLAVRDQTSHARLINAGVSTPVHVVPDTALEVSRLWPRDDLASIFADAFHSRGHDVPHRAAVIHLNRRFVGNDPELLAAHVDRIARQLDATPILLAIGPCHGDDRLQRDVGQSMKVHPLVIDRPRSLREVAACIAHAQVYLGSSMHGMVTACSYGTRGMLIVPGTAATIGKFEGLLDRFHLTQWIAETLDEIEERLSELMSAPIDQWSRVLPTAMPILDEHWTRLRSHLTLPSGYKRSFSRRLPKTEALTRLEAINATAPTTRALYSSIVAELAIQAGRKRRDESLERDRERAGIIKREAQLGNKITALKEEIEHLKIELHGVRSKNAMLRARIAKRRDEDARPTGEQDCVRTAREHRRVRKNRQSHQTEDQSLG
jgi:polysaccharide pyruvyl transferase WcaK-like protein